jgi:hypothetical protein
MTMPGHLLLFNSVDVLLFNAFTACKECSAVTNVFLSESQSDDSACHSRLLKRCKLIVSCMRKLQPLLLEIMNHTHESEDAEISGFTPVPVNTSKKQGKFNIKNVTSGV